MEDHPDPRRLERFMHGEADHGERRRIVRHLLAGCTQCAQVTRRLWSLGETLSDGSPDLGGAPLHPASYHNLFSRLAGRGLQGEQRVLADRRQAPQLLSELLAFDPAARRARIANHRRFRTPALCELLIEASRRAGEPKLSAARAEEAIAVAEALDPRRWGAALARGLLGRAWVCLGSARWRGGDLSGAEAALSLGEPALGDWAEAREQAELLELKSRLLAERGRLGEAERLLDRAGVLVRSLGQRHLEGRILVQKGTLRGFTEDPEARREGIRLLRRALLLCEPRREPPLVAFALHRLALFLADAGCGPQALATLRQARSLYERQNDGPNLVRLRHLEGKIEEGLGSLQAAEAAFLEAGQGFLAEGLGSEASAVLLDLALLYCRAGRRDAILRLAEDLLPILQAGDMQPGAATALLFFRDVVESGYVTPEVLFAVAGYLRSSPRVRRPALR
jgi:tetratricopeptide (TPR) repeat protein